MNTNICFSNEHSQEDQENAYTQDLDQNSDYYDVVCSEIFKCLNPRNVPKIEKILINLCTEFSDSKFVDINKGILYLYRGEIETSYEYLNAYFKRHPTSSLPALLGFALFNDLAQFYVPAIEMYTKILNYNIPTKYKVPILINIAIAQKKGRYNEKALEILTRLISVPEGYRWIVLIKIHMIHTLIKLKDYSRANKELESEPCSKSNIYFKRLKYYLAFLQGNYKDLIKYKNRDQKDPYLVYLVARAGMNQASPDIDIADCFDSALKITNENEYFFNSLSNYYRLNNRLADSLEQLKHALQINPNFEIALKNIAYIQEVTAEHTINLYRLEDTSESHKFHDVDPDVELLGFLDTRQLLGFKKPKFSGKKMHQLRFINSVKSEM
jgi:tetratricopeptide (TPR) repeat protein